jgi:hypothetical protein
MYNGEHPIKIEFSKWQKKHDGDEKNLRTQLEQLSCP